MNGIVPKRESILDLKLVCLINSTIGSSTNITHVHSFGVKYNGTAWRVFEKFHANINVCCRFRTKVDNHPFDYMRIIAHG